MRNPLRATTFLLRNKGKSLPLAGVVVLSVLLVAGIVAIMDSIPLSIETIYAHSRFYLGLTPRGDATRTPELREIVRKESPVPLDRIVTCRATEAEVQSIVGPFVFATLGLSQDDMRYFVARAGGGRIEGRYPKADEAEALVSEPVARNLGLGLGDALLSPKKSEAYSPMEVRVVGIVHTPEWYMLAPIEYLRTYHFPPVDLLLVFAQDPSRQNEFDHWAVARFKKEGARIYAHFRLLEETQKMFSTLYRILDLVIGMLIAVVTLMIALLMNIHLGQRVQEFGLLQALGYTRAVLLRRVVAESLLVIVGGWLAGVAVSVGLLWLTKVALMDPKAFAIDVFDPRAISSTTPIPLAILLASSWTVYQRLWKFDPVAVVERRIA